MPSHPIQIRVRAPGLLTTVQDLGRLGHAHLGFSPCGAADRVATRIANRLVGNPDGAPVVEMTLLGPTLEFSGDALVAVTGASIDCLLDGQSVPAWRPIEVPSGSALRFGNTVEHARSYLAIAGVPLAEPVLGSFSTDLGAKVGPFHGRPLAAGDVLAWQSPYRVVAHIADREVISRLYADGPLRVTPGPHREWFAPQVERQFFNSKYVVTHQSNRAGLRLRGDPLALRSNEQLLTEGVPLGAIQVPGNGQPVILFVDQQTTGGYPIMGSVISADLHRVGQLLPDSEISFVQVSIAQALDARRSLEALLQEAAREAEH
ncbi:MAG: biotin-dependent carboxyltransferase family protein [Terriglobales bacterium]